MNAEEANSIELNKEIDVAKLRDAVKYWQDKASELQMQLKLLQGNLSPKEVNSLNIPDAKKL